MIYMDENICLTPPRNKNHIADLGRWAPGRQPGDLLSSPSTPSSSPTPHPRRTSPDIEPFGRLHLERPQPQLTH